MPPKDCLAARLPPRSFLRLVGPLLCEGWKAPARILLALLGRAAAFLAECPDADAALRVVRGKALGGTSR